MFNFPSIRFAFAYGSAVFAQQGRAKVLNQMLYRYIDLFFIKGKMLDMVFAVDDTEFWHAENLRRNPCHYSAIKYLGTGTIKNIQNRACRVYYNPLVKIDDQVNKKRH